MRYGSEAQWLYRWKRADRSVMGWHCSSDCAAGNCSTPEVHWQRDLFATVIAALGLPAIVASRVGKLRDVPPAVEARELPGIKR